MRRELLIAIVALAACGPSHPSPDGGTADAGQATDGGGLPQSLVLGGLSPQSGPIVGGTTVAITGRGFAAGIVVSFGSRAGTQLNLIDGTRLTVLTPPAIIAGPVTVSALVNSEQDSLPLAFTYDAPLAVGYCVVQAPKSLDVAASATTPPVYGRVYVSGVTTAAGNEAQIEAQVGYGPSGSLPDGSWSWSPSAFNPSCNQCGNNYEYQGSFVAPAAGSYDFAYRFSADQGQTFTACDTVGNTPTMPYSKANAGKLTVGAGDAGTGDAGPGLPPIGLCALKSPTTVDAAPGVATAPIYGQLYLAGVTTTPGNQAEIMGQVGYGPPGSDPGLADAGWSWAPAAFNALCSDCNGGQNYEYDGTLTVAAAGGYALAYRFSDDQGAHFKDCDSAWDPVYNPSNAGILTVAAVDAGSAPDAGAPADAGLLPLVSWCDLQSPQALTASIGADAGPIYGRVYQPGLTTDGGHQGEIEAEVGYGPAGGDPRSQGGGFRWFPASYNPSCLKCGNNYEYQGDLVPTDAGSFDFYARFSLDDGGAWTDCSLTGPYSPDGGNDAGLLTVP